MTTIGLWGRAAGALTGGQQQRGSTVTASRPLSRSLTTARVERDLVSLPDPVVAAVDASGSSGAAIDAAVRLAAELEAPLVFVHVRRALPGFLVRPDYQRRLDKQMDRARTVLDRALRAARRAEVDAEGEILEGSPRRRILELAGQRGAQLLVVGSRRRRFRGSVAWSVARAADTSVVVACRPRARRGG